MGSECLLRHARLVAERDALRAAIPADPRFEHHQAQARVRHLRAPFQDVDRGEGWGLGETPRWARPPGHGDRPSPSTARVWPEPTAPGCGGAASSAARSAQERGGVKMIDVQMSALQPAHSRQ